MNIVLAAARGVLATGIERGDIALATEQLAQRVSKLESDAENSIVYANPESVHSIKLAIDSRRQMRRVRRDQCVHALTIDAEIEARRTARKARREEFQKIPTSIYNDRNEPPDLKRNVILERRCEFR